MNSSRSIQEESAFAVRDGPPSETVVRALTEAEGEEPTEMRPLYDVIDLEALDALFRGPNPGTVTFDYGEHTIVVRQDAEVVIK